jgi:hypothetical protein
MIHVRERAHPRFLIPSLKTKSSTHFLLGDRASIVVLVPSTRSSFLEWQATTTRALSSSDKLQHVHTSTLSYLTILFESWMTGDHCELGIKNVRLEPKQ